MYQSTSSLESSVQASSNNGPAPKMTTTDLSRSQSSLSLTVGARHLSVPLVNISKLRDRLSFKNARAAHAEKEILKRENRAVRPLTERNIDTFVIDQDLRDVRVKRAENLHVSLWLEQLP